MGRRRSSLCRRIWVRYSTYGIRPEKVRLKSTRYRTVARTLPKTFSDLDFSYQDGLGRHMWSLSNDERKGTLKNEFTSQPLGMRK